MELEDKIEAVLFFKAAPMKKPVLCKMFAVTESDLESAITQLSSRMEKGGLRLFTTDNEVSLGTAPELDGLIEEIRRDEMKRDIGKAGAETLAIVLYRGPVARADIDRIRGVNSAYILRNLQTRGLVEKNNEGKNIVFRPTTELLRHLGITDKTKLTDYVTVMNALEQYENEQSTTPT